MKKCAVCGKIKDFTKKERAFLISCAENAITGEELRLSYGNLSSDSVKWSKKRINIARSSLEKLREGGNG